MPICLCVPAEECSYWLPLYGSMCCRLAAQPHCMTQQMMTGCLKVKVSQWEPIPLTHSTFSCLFYFQHPLPTFPSIATSVCFFLFVMPHITGPFFSTSQQLGGDPQSWTEVYAVLKGTSLFCYHRQEDVEANVEPAFTIAVNKVSKRKHGKMGNLCKTFYFWRSIHPYRTYILCF